MYLKRQSFLIRLKTWATDLPLKAVCLSVLGDIIIPPEKMPLIDDANKKVDGIMGNYNMGLITNNERYNQIIDVWTSTNAHLTSLAMKNASARIKQGFQLGIYDVRFWEHVDQKNKFVS